MNKSKEDITALSASFVFFPKTRPKKSMNRIMVLCKFQRFAFNLPSQKVNCRLRRSRINDYRDQHSNYGLLFRFVPRVISRLTYYNWLIVVINNIRHERLCTLIVVSSLVCVLSTRPGKTCVSMT